jgi:nitronate monooxygenase
VDDVREPPEGYRIDALAQLAGTTVRNIRAYQDRGLLPPPRRIGRVGLYSSAHRSRLELVGRLLARGYSLANIAELLAAWEQGRDLADLLGAEATPMAPRTRPAEVTDARWLIDRFHLRVPVVGAPMAGVANARLAAAVSAAGALGMIGVGPLATGEWVANQCGAAAQAGRPFGVGLLGWSLAAHLDQLEATIDAAPALVSISFGPYEGHVGALHDAGITVTTQAGTVDEARAAEQAGVDVIVARGAEGGGHGRNEVGTLPLLQAVLAAVELPVLAAGGISTPAGLAAVLAAGAVGGWVGTAFLACEEAETSAAATERILAASETDTAYGRVFDIALGLDWPPEFGGRSLRNRYFERWATDYESLGKDPDAAEELRAARQSGDFDTAYIYAGQGAAMLRERRTAAAIMADLAAADDLIAAAAARLREAR